MTIVKMPLDEVDKRLLKRALKIRIILGLIFLFPLLFGLGLLVYGNFPGLIEGNYDFMTFFGIALSFLVCYLVYRFVIPFYKDSFRNIHVTEKLVIETRILNIDNKYTGKGTRYVIETDYMTINSWGVTILKPILPFYEMTVNMVIKIHVLENNKIDILYITRN